MNLSVNNVYGIDDIGYWCIFCLLRISRVFNDDSEMRSIQINGYSNIFPDNYKNKTKN